MTEAQENHGIFQFPEFADEFENLKQSRLYKRQEFKLENSESYWFLNTEIPIPSQHLVNYLYYKREFAKCLEIAMKLHVSDNVCTILMCLKELGRLKEAKSQAEIFSKTLKPKSLTPGFWTLYARLQLEFGLAQPALLTLIKLPRRPKEVCELFCQALSLMGLKESVKSFKWKHRRHSQDWDFEYDNHIVAMELATIEDLSLRISLNNLLSTEQVDVESGEELEIAE